MDKEGMILRLTQKVHDYRTDPKRTSMLEENNMDRGIAEEVMHGFVKALGFTNYEHFDRWMIQQSRLHDTTVQATESTVDFVKRRGYETRK